MPEISELSPRGFGFGQFSSSPSTSAVYHELQPKALGKYNVFKLYYKKTFSFKKLLDKLEPIIQGALEEIAKRSFEETKKNLAKLRSPALSPFTKEMRFGNGTHGYSWGGKKVKSTSSSKPLIQTGNLLRNIRYNKAATSLEMPAYGLIQNKGFTSQIIDRYMRVSYINVPPRPFIAAPRGSLLTSPDMLERIGTTRPMRITDISKRFGRKIRKAIKSGQKRYKSIPS